MNLSFPVHQSILAYIGCAAFCSAWHHTATAQPMSMLLPERRDMHNACAVASGKTWTAGSCASARDYGLGLDRKG